MKMWRKCNPYTLLCDCYQSKLIVLATQQANKLRDKGLGQGIVILFGKPGDQEDRGLLSPKPISLELEFRLLLY